MTKFYFGQASYNNYEHRCQILADTLELAILKFAYTKNITHYLNEESYKQGNYVYEYCHGGYEYFFKEGVLDKAWVNVLEYDEENRKYTVVKSIPYKELISINFKETERKLGSEKGVTEDSKELAVQNNQLVISYENLPAEFAQGKVNTVADYSNIYTNIQSKIIELEAMKQELSSQITEMEKWLESKYRIICAYETYLGTREEVVELIGTGKTSDKPIHFYQTVMYMDEEYGLVNLEKMDTLDFVEWHEFDYKHIKFFDDWIKEHYKEYIPEENSIRPINKEFNGCFI